MNRATDDPIDDVEYKQDDEDNAHMQQEIEDEVLPTDDPIGDHAFKDILLDITLTEALIESTIRHRNDDTPCLIKCIPTLETIIHKHHRMVHKLLIILTFDFESKLHRNAQYLIQGTIIKKMTEFSNADEFEQYIYTFLQNRDASYRLLLQYIHQQDGMNHFTHIIFDRTRDPCHQQ
eukprot:504279_1